MISACPLLEDLCSPRFASVGIQLRGTNSLEEHPHVILGDLRVGQDKAALLREDARNPIAVKWMSKLQASRRPCPGVLQQVALQPQRHWRFWLDDNATCLGHVNLKNSLPVDLFRIRPRPQCRDKPLDIS